MNCVPQADRRSDAAPRSSRRDFVLQIAKASAARAVLVSMPRAALSQSQSDDSRRPALGDRKFSSPQVEAYIRSVTAQIRDKELATLFANCFPNALDTAVVPGEFDGKPDTVVLTGDIPAMWLRDSSAQVWPYLPFAAQDAKLRALLEGVIRRQTRCLLIDPYANAFMQDLNAPPLEWSRQDQTTMKPGVGERKYELDSLCHPIRLAYGYWKQTRDRAPFDRPWQQAMHLSVQTMRTQQQKSGPGPYNFQRSASAPTDTLVNGLGNPIRPCGLIASAFRPSDDACIFSFLVPSNLFASRSLRQLAEMASELFHDSDLASECHSLADEVDHALLQHALVARDSGRIWAYEVDGFGGQVLMDDAAIPSLLSLPYLDCSPDAQIYARTRRFVWSKSNPWFFQGPVFEGIGSPHVGRDKIWPMAQTIYGLTSESDAEILRCIEMLKASSANTGFIHESFDVADPGKFTRSWFSWANTLFGEFVGKVARTRPALLAR